MNLYHATQIGNHAGHEGLCLTDDRDAALGYLDGASGVLETWTMPADAAIASDDDVRTAARSLGLTEGYTFEFADRRDVRVALLSQGYTAAWYRDLGPSNGYEHDTLVVLDPAAVTRVAVEAAG